MNKKTNLKAGIWTIIFLILLLDVLNFDGGLFFGIFFMTGFIISAIIFIWDL